uniref:Cysteine-rich venom protein n=1 Tax=Hemiscolopendra marginata TaxID=943146 RepID=A0A646QH87_9MYRI
MKSINRFITVFLMLSCNLLLGDTCSIIEQGFDATAKATILDLHNKARQKVANGQQSGQPTASNMKELLWDDELALAAQDWAVRCIHDHPPLEQKNTKKYKQYGQNYYGGFGSDIIKHVGVAVKMWYDEVKDLNPNTVSSYDGNFRLYGHYTTIVWGDTSVMGCGYTKEASTDRVNIFCNYAPANYFVGKPIYRVGPTASKCRKGESTSYPGLCKK